MGCSKSSPKPKSDLRVNEVKLTLNLDAKVVLLGDSGVGKSSIAVRYVNNTFSEAFEVTIGGGFLQQTARLSDGTNLKLDIWDTGGQERFRSLLQLYYRDASAALITYDIGVEKSLESCEYWVNELKSNEKDCILFLVGNKSDLPERRLDQKRAEAFASRHGMSWIETSAKTGDNINKLFEMVGSQIVRQKSSENKG